MGLQNFSLNLGGGGTASIPEFDPTSNTQALELFEEFNFETNAAPQGPFHWVRYAAGGGAVHVDVAPTSSETNRYGIHQVTPSTTASIPGGFYSNNARSLYPGAQSLEFACAIQVGKVADATDDWIYVAGFQNTPNILQTDGVYFYFDRSISANWQLQCRRASSNTTRDTGVAVSTSWTNLRFTVNSDWTSVQAYINGSAVGAPVTTNIPNAATLGPQIYMYRVAGTAATTNFKIDWAYLQYQFAVSRGSF